MLCGRLNDVWEGVSVCGEICIPGVCCAVFFVACELIDKRQNCYCPPAVCRESPSDSISSIVR